MEVSLVIELSKLGYKVLDKLGQGGYGSVYKVSWSKYPGKIFAMKVIYKVSKSSINTYQNEINALQKLESSNIIYIFNHFSVDDKFCIVFEYCSNGNLTEYVRKNGPLNTRDFKKIVYQIIQALHDCHSMGIAHLDIKPDNIIMNEYQQIKLCDFGISVQVDEENIVKHHAGSILYCAPERFNQLYDPFKADIWSLGLTCYYLIYGYNPFSMLSSYKQIVAAIKDKDIIFEPKINLKILRMIKSMLEANPFHRPSMEQLLNDELFNNSTSITRNLSCTIQTEQSIRPKALRHHSSIAKMNIIRPFVSHGSHLLLLKYTGPAMNSY